MCTTHASLSQRTRARILNGRRLPRTALCFALCAGVAHKSMVKRNTQIIQRCVYEETCGRPLGVSHSLLVDMPVTRAIRTGALVRAV